MAKMQFIALLTPSVGSFVLVILAWLHQNQRLSDLRSDTNRQFDQIARQFSDVKQSLATLTSDYRSFYGMEQKLEARRRLSKRIQ